jgi:hypothetical protein
MVYAYQDEKVRSQLKELINDPKSSSQNIRKIGKIIMGSEGNQKLRRKIENIINLQLKNQVVYKENGVGEEAALLLRVLSVG